MRRLCIILLFLIPASALCQVTTQRVHTECPVEATRITPRVYAFRIYTVGAEGWRPASKMALDLRVRNKGDRDIAAISFEIKQPTTPNVSNWNDLLLARFDQVIVNVKA